MGKPIASDIKQGKRTLLIVKALEKANAKQRKFIRTNLGNENITSKQVKELRKIVIETGSLDHSKNLIKKLITPLTSLPLSI